MIEIKLKLQIILIIAFLSLGFLFLKPVQATVSIVRGAAWWANQSSYLYFNCLDDVIGDRLDVQYNLCGGVYFPPNPFTCGKTPYLFHFYSAPCSSLIHRVYLASNGNFSGKAWNYAKGLVTFDGTNTPDNYNFNIASKGDCPECNSANDCMACYNENTQKVYGWAKALNDGTWINLSPATTSPVQIKSWNIASTTNSSDYNLNPGDFIGYATTTSSNLSFNCFDTSGNANCTSYKVYISNLQIGHLSAPNWNYSEACSSGALEAVLKWNLKSGGSALNSSWLAIDYQIGFQIIINTKNSTTTPLFNSGLQSGSATQYIVNGNNLTYGTNYYWWVRLLDNNHHWTPWYQFGGTKEHQGLNDTISPADMGNTYTSPNAKTFSTYQHAFPTPYFTWSPSSVLVGTTTTLLSTGQNGKSCYGNNCDYLWTVSGDPDALFYDLITGASSTTSIASSTSIIFKHATDTVINLKVTDPSTYYCSTSTSLLIKYALPIWREVKAQ